MKGYSTFLKAQGLELNVIAGGHALGESYPSAEMQSVYSTVPADCIGLVGRVFTNGPGDMGSILGRIIPKTSKMVLDTTLLSTQQYKLCIKGKESRPPLHLGVVASGFFFSTIKILI